MQIIGGELRRWVVRLFRDFFVVLCQKKKHKCLLDLPSASVNVESSTRTAPWPSIFFDVKLYILIPIIGCDQKLTDLYLCSVNVPYPFMYVKLIPWGQTCAKYWLECGNRYDKQYSCYFCFFYGITLKKQNNSHQMDLTSEYGAKISKSFFFPE